MARERIALIGLGAIGRAVADGLAREPEGGELVAVLVRPAHVAAAGAALPATVAIATTIGALLAKRPTLVVECAGQSAVAQYGEGVLAAGGDLLVVSTGALAAPGLLDQLKAAARASGARLIVPAGAIAGLDGLGALKRAGLTRVTYTSTKPPLAWRGTAAESLIDLASVAEPTVFFEGTAREAALAYPKNANLAATVALAGLGFDATRVRLVADPAAAANTGEIEAESAAGTMRLVMAGRASANPKTSASVAYSVLHAVAARGATLVI
jgi:aspartate dehydrogenase